MWVLTANVLKHETMKLGRESIKTLSIEPIGLVDGQEIRGKAWFNISEDASRRPIRVVYKAPFGTVVGTLQLSDGKL